MGRRSRYSKEHDRAGRNGEEKVHPSSTVSIRGFPFFLFNLLRSTELTASKVEEQGQHMPIDYIKSLF
jgi:hypothetical protein